MQRLPTVLASLESRMRPLGIIGAAAASCSATISAAAASAALSAECGGSGSGGGRTSAGLATTTTTAFLQGPAVHPPLSPLTRSSSISSSRALLQRPFHSSSPLCRKSSRSKWKAAKKYAAAAERDEEEEDTDNATVQHDDEKDRNGKFNDEPIYDPPDDVVERQSLDWIRNCVIGLNLCPFASQPLQNNRLLCTVVRGTDDETIASAVLLELILRVDEPGTTVVIAPECHPEDFEEYLKVVSYVEGTLMDEHELHGKVQLAPFHPRFEFGGSGPDGVDNFTNRSPYPMFHVLREDEVSAAVDKLDGDAGKVWRRNVRLLEEMDESLGRDGVERVMKGNGETVEGLDDVLSKVKDEEE